VAGSAILREPGLHVVGVRCPLEILQVATDAIRDRDFVIPIDVTGKAIQRGVHTDQGIACELGVVKPRAHPTVHVVARLASRRKLQHPMIRNRLSKILIVTRYALRR